MPGKCAELRTDLARSRLEARVPILLRHCRELLLGRGGSRCRDADPVPGQEHRDGQHGRPKGSDQKPEWCTIVGHGAPLIGARTTGLEAFQPLSASAPATTSRISCVISAWRARFSESVRLSISSPAFFEALRIAAICEARKAAADSSSAR